MEIHGQNDHQRLFEPAEQLRLVDAFGALAGPLEGYRERRSRQLGLAEELERLERRVERLQRIDSCASRSPSSSRRTAADEAPGSAPPRLRHAAELRAELGASLDRLSEGDSAALDAVRSAERAVTEWSSRVSGLEEPASELREAALHLEEAVRGLAGFFDGVEDDPARLEAAEERLGQLERLGASTAPMSRGSGGGRARGARGDDRRRGHGRGPARRGRRRTGGPRRVRATAANGADEARDQAPTGGRGGPRGPRPRACALLDDDGAAPRGRRRNARGGSPSVRPVRHGGRRAPLGCQPRRGRPAAAPRGVGRRGCADPPGPAGRPRGASLHADPGLRRGRRRGGRTARSEGGQPPRAPRRSPPGAVRDTPPCDRGDRGAAPQGRESVEGGRTRTRITALFGDDRSRRWPT